MKWKNFLSVRPCPPGNQVQSMSAFTAERCLMRRQVSNKISLLWAPQPEKSLDATEHVSFERLCALLCWATRHGIHWPPEERFNQARRPDWSLRLCVSVLLKLSQRRRNRKAFDIDIRRRQKEIYLLDVMKGYILFIDYTNDQKISRGCKDLTRPLL